MGTNEFTDAETFKGNDIDTDGDGTVNDAETLQGNQPSDLKTEADGITINKNSNSKLQQILKKEIIGNWENGDLAGWSKFGDEKSSISVTDSPFYAPSPYNGSYCIQIINNNSSGDVNGVEVTVDLTDKDKFSHYAAFDSRNRYTVFIGGNKELEKTTSQTDQAWRKYEVDVSNYSGNTKIRIETEYDTKCEIDFGLLLNENPVNIEEVNSVAN